MNERRVNSIRNLSSLYTVVIGVALSLSAVQLVGNTTGLLGVSLSEALLFLSFVFTLVPFYHGALRHLDDAYLENKNPHIRDGALIIDVLLLIIHGMAFVALALLLKHPSHFAWVMLVLIAIDVIWGIFTYSGASTQTDNSTEGKWALINSVFVLISGAGLYIADIGLETDVDPTKLALVIFIVCLLRTGVDYGFCWKFYFPDE